MVDYRPSTGSCPVCGEPLSLASVKADGRWYDTPACAEGRPDARTRPPVPEPWLYPRPRRFLRKRRPKELKAAPPHSGLAATRSTE